MLPVNRRIPPLFTSIERGGGDFLHGRFKVFQGTPFGKEVGLAPVEGAK